MKQQIIELEDGSKWKLHTDPYMTEGDHMYRQVWFKRLPPPNPMPELKVGYRVYLRDSLDGVYGGTNKLGHHFLFSGSYDCPSPWSFSLDAISEIHCPHRGLIWSKGE